MVIELPVLKKETFQSDFLEEEMEFWNEMETNFEKEWLFEPISYENADIEMPILNFGKDGDKFFGGTVYSNDEKLKNINRMGGSKYSSMKHDYFKNKENDMFQLLRDLGVDMTQVASLEITKVKSGSDLYPKQEGKIEDVAVIVITKK